MLGETPLDMTESPQLFETATFEGFVPKHACRKKDRDSEFPTSATSDELMSGDSFSRHSTTSVVKKWRKQIRPEVRTPTSRVRESIALSAAPTSTYFQKNETLLRFPLE
jgi:hypothetical protein